MAKKPAPKKAAKPAKKAAPKKAAKPVKKAAPKKAAASKPVKKAAPAKKAAKPAPKAKKAAPAKPAPAKKAAPAPKKAVAKAAPKAPVKAPAKAPAPVAKAPVKPAPKAPPAKSEAPKPVAKATVKKEKEKEESPKAGAGKPLVTQTSAPVIHKAAPMVKKHVSTLESPNKERYSDAELEEFKAIINAKLEEARKDYDLLKQTLANTDNNGTEDTSPSFKMIEDGSETLSREETAQLAGRQEKFIKHLEDALLRIRNKTYGICRVTGRLISKERLRLVPHATLSIEAKQQMSS